MAPTDPPLSDLLNLDELRHGALRRLPQMAADYFRSGARDERTLRDLEALFAADLFRMYSRYAETQGWKVEVMSLSEASAGGIKEAIASISGDKVYSQLRFEGGVHRVQRAERVLEDHLNPLAIRT